jgi:hypothetical protein
VHVALDSWHPVQAYAFCLGLAAYDRCCHATTGLLSLHLVNMQRKPCAMQAMHFVLMGGATVAGQGHKREKTQGGSLQCELQCATVLWHVIFQNLEVGRGPPRRSAHACAASTWEPTRHTSVLHLPACLFLMQAADPASRRSS